MRKSKKVIVFEGVDGSGKSTQARLLYFTFKKRGIRTDLYHFPSEDILGKFVRELLENEKFDVLDPRSRALLTAADFYSQYRENSNADVVIFDRYLYSSYVSNDVLEKEWIKILHKYVPSPDIVFFLDGDPKLIKHRKDIDFGAKNEERQKTFSLRYKNIFKDIPNITINADKDINVIHEEVLRHVKEKLSI